MAKRQEGTEDGWEGSMEERERRRERRERGGEGKGIKGEISSPRSFL